MRNVLVTGGAGFIGANFLHYWCPRHPAVPVTVLDALTYAGNRSSLQELESSGAIRFVHGRIEDQTLVESLLRDYGIDTVVHLAAESHVDRSIHGPDLFVETNVIGTHSLLKACRKVWLTEGRTVAHRFHHVSTDEVYGSLGEHDPAFTESSPYAPNSPYAASKAASDHLVRAYHRTYGLEVTTTNCSNNYGPYHFPEKLIPLTVINILDGRSIPIYGDGANVRDWLYVEDHCRAIELVLGRGEVGTTYNVGGSAELTNIELVRLLCAAVDKAIESAPEWQAFFPRSPAANGQTAESLIRFVKDRPGHDRRYSINATRISDELGFRPSVDLLTGLEQTVEWFIKHEQWWRQVQSGEHQQWIKAHYGQEA